MVWALTERFTLSMPSFNVKNFTKKSTHSKWKSNLWRDIKRVYGGRKCTIEGIAAALKQHNETGADATLEVNGGGDIDACARGGGGIGVRAKLLFHACT